MILNKLAVALAAAGFASGAYATNGMNLEGYGPVAAGMGGASMAYDNGTAAVMNNPATLSLMADGSRLDVAVGFLGPDVKMQGVEDSGGNAYFMPAIGWVKKDGDLSYGVAVFAQGGMGTEFNTTGYDRGTGYDYSGKERSELGVGRFILPVSYKFTPEFSLGGSLDYVWAMLDMRMAMPSSAMTGLITSSSGVFADPVLMPALVTYYDAGRLDFSDDSDYTGKAKGAGFAGKLGFTYKLSPTLTFGGTYHSKTALGDLKTSDSGANMIFTNTAGSSFPFPASMAVPGKVIVHDFQWPETYGVGLSLQATPTVMVAADVKYIGWKDVMKDFTMTYSTPDAGGFGPGSATFKLPQNWDDQTVFSLGVAFKVTDAFTLRAGANLSDNPIPDSTMHYLFPAIVKDHYTLGFGYAFSPMSEVNFSVQYAPEVKQTNSTYGYTVTHAQTNAQLMYSGRF